ncbi:anti-sigma factor domain-containing protein [Paenactinomyces guangxiensis]|uniref:Anti-sigma factor domain-containing protein n=1 Tax=Paenactinomyces guangxiensis TaxID=1490290 RepID=A0A7W2A9H9_9BACL|nr:anti-sigma factor domain-containing protein [Paenactinomyces guangxiensis]MBA4494913.1 anti-sigma factor domain-containing protein [Paenactinomyces guangxiensis]MBH8591996.1 anti-sigma factor domain-containing protein [Paenactinomyces guangxiensis]
MNRGIIMEVQTQHWIVMTPDGEFVKVPRSNPSAQIGEEVTFQAKRTAPRRSWITAASVAVAAMLGFFFIFPQLSPNEAHAETYIYLDVNPSVAIGLDSENRVVEVKPLNYSARKLLGRIDYKNATADEFVVDFLVQARSHGYLHKKDHLVLSGIQEEKNSVTAIKNLEKAIKKNRQVGENNLGLAVHTLSIPKKVSAKAAENGLSPTKYAVWLLAKKDGKDIPVEELGEKSITELANDLEPVTEMLEDPLSETEWDQMIQTEDPKAAQPQDKAPEEENDKETPVTTQPEEPSKAPQTPDSGPKKPDYPEGSTSPGSSSNGTTSSDTPPSNNGTGDSNGAKKPESEANSSEVTE